MTDEDYEPLFWSIVVRVVAAITTALAAGAALVWRYVQ